ncbi:MAG: RHS repeat-associated core domain-containing protein [Terracidiphilus sp.]
MTVSAICAIDEVPRRRAITDTYDYDAFGNKINSTGSTPNNFLYRGEAYDSDLGLYYLRARYYNPLTGRFMSRDPENGQIKVPSSLHKYLYAGGDPVNGWDPTGREEEEYELPFPQLLANIRKSALIVKATWYVACVAVYTDLWSQYSMFGPGEAAGEAAAYCKILLGI